MSVFRGKITAQSDVITARQAAREMARNLGFGSADQTRLATAMSELTRNVIQYADHGIYSILDKSDNKSIMIQAVVEDYGPGIADIDQALEYGFSTSRGLGAGLPGTKRLVHDFRIESKPGLTRVTISMARTKHFS
jgi:serine/threonine-protein kinase RsbT